MSRKLYMNDEAVRALQDHLKPVQSTTDIPALKRAIDEIMGMRRNTGQNWVYRTVDSAGVVWFGQGGTLSWEATSALRDAAKAQGIHLPRGGSQAEDKKRANALAAYIGLGVVIERRILDSNEPWARWYAARPEKAQRFGADGRIIK